MKSLQIYIIIEKSSIFHILMHIQVYIILQVKMKNRWKTESIINYSSKALTIYRKHFFICNWKTLISMKEVHTKQPNKVQEHL